MRPCTHAAEVSSDPAPAIKEPLLGEYTCEIMREVLGYSVEEIEAAREEGATGSEDVGGRWRLERRKTFRPGRRKVNRDRDTVDRLAAISQRMDGQRPRYRSVIAPNGLDSGKREAA